MAVLAMFAAVAVALLAFGAWLGLLALHLGAGGTMGDAMAMTLDDARVAATCPRELGAVAAFLTRDATLPLRSLPDPDGARALICDGRYKEIASGISRP